MIKAFSLYVHRQMCTQELRHHCWFKNNSAQTKKQPCIRQAKPRCSSPQTRVGETHLSTHTLSSPRTDSWSRPSERSKAPRADQMITLTRSSQTEQTPGEVSRAQSVLCSHTQDMRVGKRRMPPSPSWGGGTREQGS